MPNTVAEARRQIVARVSSNLQWLEELKTHQGGGLIPGLTSKIDKTLEAMKVVVAAASIDTNARESTPRA
jgi:hypothetical protein